MKIWSEDGESNPHIKFSTNGTEVGYTEITSIVNYFAYGFDYGLTDAEIVTYSIDEVTTWATHLQSDKDLITDFVEANRFVASIPTEVRADIAAPYLGFKIFNTTTNQPEWWNGSVWTGNGTTTTGFKEFGSADLDTLSSTTRTFLSTSGRAFLSHAGNGTSNTYCSSSIVLDQWISGGKLQVHCTSGLDGVKFFKYYVTVTIWNGGTKTQETLYFTKVLTAATSDYPQLKTNEIELSGTLLAAMGNGYTITFKLGRDAADVDDDYNSSIYTEVLTFKYNY